jgi:hypothetical protein
MHMGALLRLLFAGWPRRRCQEKEAIQLNTQRIYELAFRARPPSMMIKKKRQQPRSSGSKTPTCSVWYCFNSSLRLPLAGLLPAYPSTDVPQSCPFLKISRLPLPPYRKRKGGRFDAANFSSRTPERAKDKPLTIPTWSSLDGHGSFKHFLRASFQAPRTEVFGFRLLHPSPFPGLNQLRVTPYLQLTLVFLTNLCYRLLIFLTIFNYLHHVHAQGSCQRGFVHCCYRCSVHCFGLYFIPTFNSRRWHACHCHLERWRLISGMLYKGSSFLNSN